jgi:hypothetical protein
MAPNTSCANSQLKIVLIKNFLKMRPVQTIPRMGGRVDKRK